MKKNYINPEVQVAQYASMSLMKAASSPSGGSKLNDIETDDQW